MQHARYPPTKGAELQYGTLGLAAAVQQEQFSHSFHQTQREQPSLSEFPIYQDLTTDTRTGGERQLTSMMQSRPFSRARALFRLLACSAAAAPAGAGARTAACPPLVCCFCLCAETCTKPKTFSASNPARGVVTAPSAPIMHLSNAYTDVRTASGTT